VACEGGSVVSLSLACSPRGSPAGCSAPLAGLLPINWTLPAGLRSLDLSANRLSGPLPPGLGMTAPGLTLARLGHNAWSGGIPPAWASPLSPIAAGRAVVSLVGSCGLCGEAGSTGLPEDALDVRGTSLGVPCPGAGPDCAGERTGPARAASSALAQVTVVLSVTGAGVLLWSLRAWSRRSRAAEAATAAGAGRAVPPPPPPTGLRGRLVRLLWGPPPPPPPPAVYTGRRSINLAEMGGGGGGGGPSSSSSSPHGKAGGPGGACPPAPPPALVIGPDGGACVGVRLPSCRASPAGSVAGDGAGDECEPVGGGGYCGGEGDVEAPAVEEPPPTPGGGAEAAGEEGGRPC